MKKRLFAALLAVSLFILHVVPAAAFVPNGHKDQTPDGYNMDDYMRAVVFMETEDENGVKNGEKIVSFFNGHYSPDDPESWSYFYYDHENAIFYIYGVFWTDGEEKRVSALYLYGMDLVGELDLSGMNELYEVYCDFNKLTSIDASGCSTLRVLTCKNNVLDELWLSGCTSLDLFDCSYNALTALDASECVSVTDIECANNKLAELDVSGCSALQWLNCSHNLLSDIDVSNNASLAHLCCFGNCLTALDLSNNPALPFDMIRAVGQGHIGYSNYGYINENDFWVSMDAAVAEPDQEEEFLGWYSEDGERISSALELDSASTAITRVYARFTGA